MFFLYPSYRHKTVFTISPIQFSTKTETNEHNVMDLQHSVRRENVDKLNSCTQFILCRNTSTQKHNPH
jgi:hypothetical protein